MDGIDDTLTLVGFSKGPFELATSPGEGARDLYNLMIQYYGEPRDWTQFSLTQEPRPGRRPTESPRYVPINLEKRLRTLEETMAALGEALIELKEALRDRPIAYSSQIVDLGSEEISLRHPIPIVVEECDEQTVASFPETETFGSGGTPSEAIAELKRQIIFLLHDLATSDHREFGKLPAAWCRILQYYISDQ